MFIKNIETDELLDDFIANKTSVAILNIDKQQKITDCNNGFMKLFFLTEKPLGAALSDFLISPGSGVLLEAGSQEFRCNPKTRGQGVLIAHRLPHKNGLLLWCERPINNNNQVVEQMTRLNNEFIALQRELTKKNHQLNQTGHELEEKVAQLESALSQVKRLESILPICIYCKRIRDDSGTEHGKGKWMVMEEFLYHKGGSSISHGCCRECYEKHKDD